MPSAAPESAISAQLLEQGGEGAVGLAGLIIVICGLVLVAEGARRKFMKYLRTAQMSARMRRVVELFGMTGTIARGLVFALAGVLVIDAAITHKASPNPAASTRRCSRCETSRSASS